MKIAFLRTDRLVDYLPVGGSFSHIRGFLSGLEKLGHQTIFISSVDHGPPETFPWPCRLVPYGRYLGIFPEVPQIAYNFTFVKRAYGILKKDKPDVLYQRHSIFNVAGVLLSSLLRVPLILEVNDLESWLMKNWSYLKFEGLARLYERAALTGAGGIAVVSDVLRDDLVRFGARGEKILVNPNGFDEDRFLPSRGGERIRKERGLSGKTVIGFLGTFGVWHGILVLAEVIPRVLEVHPDARFLIVGDGQLKGEFRKKIEEAGCADRVVMTGYVSHEEVPAYLDACDILVSPHVPNQDGTLFFGSPTKLFEYMGMGKGIVASDLGQLGQVLSHEKTAYLVRPGDPESLRSGIEALIRDTDLRTKIGKEVRKEALKKYSWTRNAERVVNLAEKLLEKRR